MTTCTEETDPRIWPRGTEEFLDGFVIGNVVLDSQRVFVTFDRFADPVVLLEAEWTGTGKWLGPTDPDDPAYHTEYYREWRTTDLVTDANLPDADTVELFVKVVDTSEIPYIQAGSITFI